MANIDFINKDELEEIILLVRECGGEGDTESVDCGVPPHLTLCQNTTPAHHIGNIQ